MANGDDRKIFPYYWPHYALVGSVFFPVMCVLQITAYDQIIGGLVSLGIGVVCLMSGVKKWKVPYIVLTKEEVIIRDGWFHGEPTKILRWDDMRRFNRRRGYEFLVSMKKGAEERIPLFCMRDPAIKELEGEIIVRIEEANAGKNQGEGKTAAAGDVL